ncbi:YigZ family protein [Shewanella waksmanii]|uniref:YigZ family protein n=1 Tax=Shewanella waksmanii TaxID=213783 RepID=UPI00048D717F|nr:YigZ family protein [Shewanella waksmanii]
MSESYLIPAQTYTFEEEIKHSRFITVLFHCDSEEVFKCVLTNLKVEYPGANHYCYAFVSAAPDNQVAIGSSDDGEPAGSAGRPMLASLQGANIGEIGAVVIRYFGGTKLGVGGLVRAYSSGIKQAVKLLPTSLKQIRYRVSLACDYAQLKDIEHFVSKANALIEDRVFADQVTLIIAIPKASLTELNADLATISQGQLQLRLD